jgi:hypothetical protein
MTISEYEVYGVVPISRRFVVIVNGDPCGHFDTREEAEAWRKKHAPKGRTIVCCCGKCD